MSMEISQGRLLKDARRVLENPFWIPELSSEENYTRIQDDHDGTFKGNLEVFFLPHIGDICISTDTRPYEPIRFSRSWWRRTKFAGKECSYDFSLCYKTR